MLPIKEMLVPAGTKRRTRKKLKPVTKEMLVPAGTKRRTRKKLKPVTGVTIHEAGTPNAPAVNLAKVQVNSPNAVVNGWHFSVDDKEIYQSFPLDEVAEHSGKRLGNDSTVAIEIADKVTTGIYWKTAVENAAELAAWILKKQGFTKAVWKQNIFQHNDWSGKDCPYQIRRKNPIDWTTFVTKVNSYMAEKPKKPYLKKGAAYYNTEGTVKADTPIEITVDPHKPGKDELVRALIGGDKKAHIVLEQDIVYK